MKFKILTFILVLCSISASAQRYSLDSCKKKAIEHNYKMKNAVLESEISKQTKKEAFTKYFPVISAEGFAFQANEHMVQKDLDLRAMASVLPFLAKPVHIGLLKKGKMANIMAMQPIFMGGRIIYGNKLAKVGEEVSILKLQLSVDEVNQKTEDIFWKIVSLKDKLQTVKTLMVQLESIHKDAELAVKAGIVNMNEVLRVELKQQELESSKLKIENGITINKLLLSQHIGAMSNRFDIAVDSFSTPEPPLRYYVDANEAVKYRIEYEVLDKNVEAKSLQVKLERGKLLPTVGIGGGYVYNDFTEQANSFGVAFASVRVPISDWWGGSHAVKRAKLKKMQAENEKQDAIEMMIVEINQTWNELQEAYKQITLYRKSVISSTENLRLNSNYYKAGISTLTDLLDAQSLLQQSRDQYSEACSEYQVKLFKYKQKTRQGL